MLDYICQSTNVKENVHVRGHIIPYACTEIFTAEIK